MYEFFYMIADFYAGIFDKLNQAVFRYGSSSWDVTSVGSVLFAAIVIGFVVSIFWKGARS